MYLTKQMNSFYMYFVRCGFMTVHRIKTSPGVSIKTCMMKINFHQTDISLIQFHFSAMTSVYLLCSLHQPWFIFCFVWHLKFALQLDGSATSPLLTSPPLSLFTFLLLSMSHRECHQPPLRLMPVNMAARLSARSLLLSLLFALTLDEFIKEKKKGNGRK